MPQGNFANQRVMYDHHVVDVVNRVLQTTVFQQCSLPEVTTVHTAVMQVQHTC